MEDFMQKEKNVCWLVLIVLLLLPMVMKVNISIQLLFNSLACVCLGSMYAISVKKDKRVEHESDDEDDTVSMEDALKFPFYASAALIVLYILFKNIDKDLLNPLFKANFSIMGMTCIGNILTSRIPLIFPQISNKLLMDKKFEVFGHKQHVYLSIHNIMAYGIGFVIGLMYLLTNHWSLNNILGIVFTISGIMLIKISNFKTVFLLLGLLFFYDIFWVFKSDLMVTVAKNFDVPIKLILPLGDGKSSILGLGDMVIPGILLALGLKFDVDMALENFNKKKEKLLKFETPHFWSSVVGYALGIISTFVSMMLMEHAQPALLYLVPWCCATITIQAIIQRKLMKFWKYEALPKELKKKEEKDN